MKIVHISHLYSPSQGGVQFFFKNVSERLVKNYGDDVTVVTTNSLYGPERKIFKRVEPNEEVINGVKVIRFPYWRFHLPLLSFLFKVLAKLSIAAPEWMIQLANGPFSPSMKRYLLKVEADAFGASSSNYYYMKLPLWRKCKFFYYGSIHLPKDEKKHHLHDWQLKSMKASTLYLANTIYEKKSMVRLGVPEEKVFVLGTGVDINSLACEPESVTDFRSQLGLATGDVLIGYVGRIERTKNVQVLVKTFLNVGSYYQNVHLLIAGSGNEHINELKKIISSFPSDIASRIHFVINFPAEEKAVIFNSLDIFVLPSNNESFGIVFLEAWSCRKPVIGSAIGAVNDVINNNVDGLLMKPNDEESLFQQLSILIEDKNLRDEMGERGYQKVSENYTWEIITDRLRKCYSGKIQQSNFYSKKQTADV